MCNSNPNASAVPTTAAELRTFAVPFRGFKKVAYSTWGLGYVYPPGYTEAVLEIAASQDNTAGAYLDDFNVWNQTGVEMLHTLQRQLAPLRREGRNVSSFVCVYSDLMHGPTDPTVDAASFAYLLRNFDHPILFTSAGRLSLPNLTADFQSFEKRTGPGRMFGIYLFDFSANASPAREVMETQLKFGEQLLQSGRIDGMVFVASDVCDVGVPAVEQVRQWVRDVGPTPIRGKTDDSASLLPPGPRLRDLAAARKPPLLFGGDFVDECFQPGSACKKNGTYAAVAAAEFNAGNDDFCLVWSASQPNSSNVYDFTCADRVFDFMKENKQIYAHVNAVMQAHNVAAFSPCCCPKWLTDGYPYSSWSRRSYPYNFTRAQVRDFLQNRIESVVPRWVQSGVEVRGIFPINEAIANQPYKGRGGWPHTWLTGAEENLFSWAFGDDAHNSTEWFGQTFKWVRAAADKAGATKLRLFYNDYSIETPGAKTDAVYRWVTEQKKAGVPIDGVGFQSHLSCDCRDGCNDTTVVAANMRRFIEAGLDVWVTELDVKMSKQCTEEDQAAVYSALLGACLANAPHCDSFVTWGFTDKYDSLYN